MGYIGINCDVRCTFPLFGLDCQLICNCSEKNCDYDNGCRHSTKEGFNVTLGKGGANDLQTDLKNMVTASYQGNSLMYPIVGLSVAAVIITTVYIYTWTLEKRILSTISV